MAVRKTFRKDGKIKPEKQNEALAKILTVGALRTRRIRLIEREQTSERKGWLITYVT